ncbi:hypothetical protein PTTG_29019 [Puccinia triticina 1-1 BBBD Race 1]|uniref:Uncharacterized protein n=1 Tax=Puccinia triticina (isolate 1-1 / race 1 (BBBD)) TaxID=630390 RepID=A0A180G706_PUCT1|nr:hypothetical protein PTTG_29019 [Puccinia triticina 1-1 BBBD Race 1]
MDTFSFNSGFHGSHDGSVSDQADIPVPTVFQGQQHALGQPTNSDNHRLISETASDESLHGTMADTEDPKEARPGPDKSKLTATQMAHFLTLDPSSLRASAASYATRKRMTDEMKEELEEMYYEFQCEVARRAIQNRVGSHLYFNHLGQTRKVRGGTSWNNFQKYDPEAQKLFDEFGCEQGRSEVSALWATKSLPQKLRYRDMDYLKTLREVSTGSASSNAPHLETVLHAPLDQENDPVRLNGRIQVSKVLLQKTASLVSEWVKKTQSDLDSFAFFHQVKGFVVTASCHPKSPIFHKFGSPVGNWFLRMLAQQRETDAAAEFHTWTAAQAIQVSKGCASGAGVPPTGHTKIFDDVSEQFRVGKHNKNISAIRHKLKDLIYIASGRKIRTSWPGEDTDYDLRRLKISLKINHNEWSIVPEDLKQPLVKLSSGQAMGTLACLGLNKIHLTYHPDWEDIPPRPRRKNKKRKDVGEGNNDTEHTAHDHDHPPQGKRPCVRDSSPAIDAPATDLRNGLADLTNCPSAPSNAPAPAATAPSDSPAPAAPSSGPAASDDPAAPSDAPAPTAPSEAPAPAAPSDAPAPAAPINNPAAPSDAPAPAAPFNNPAAPFNDPAAPSDAPAPAARSNDPAAPSDAPAPAARSNDPAAPSDTPAAPTNVQNGCPAASTNRAAVNDPAAPCLAASTNRADVNDPAAPPETPAAPTNSQNGRPAASTNRAAAATNGSAAQKKRVRPIKKLPKSKSTTPSAPQATVDPAPYNNPAAPSINPAAPSINPAAPSINPSAPSINPAAPSINPAAPSINPAAPSDATTPATAGDNVVPPLQLVGLEAAIDPLLETYSLSDLNF